MPAVVGVNVVWVGRLAIAAHSLKLLDREDLPLPQRMALTGALSRADLSGLAGRKRPVRPH